MSALGAVPGWLAAGCCWLAACFAVLCPLLVPLRGGRGEEWNGWMQSEKVEQEGVLPSSAPTMRCDRVCDDVEWGERGESVNIYI